MAAKQQIVLLTGSANPKLAERVAKILKMKIHCPVSRFSDGEVRVIIKENLCRKDVFLIQPTPPPVNDNLMELLLMIDAAKRASAGRITAVIPYFGYSRQDRSEQPGAPVSAAVVATMIKNAGADHILTIDIHSEQQRGAFGGPWDNLYGSSRLLPAITALKTKKLVIASPDKGGSERAIAFGTHLKADVAFAYKQRDISRSNHSEAMGLVGEVAGKDVVLVDDMIDTGGTMVHAAELMMEKGARSVRIATTHGLFSGSALEKLSDSPVKQVFVTDTILPKAEVVTHPKIRIISVAELLARAIGRINRGEPINED